MTHMPHVTIYSDGAFSKKNNAGGWASYLTYNDQELILCDYVQATTNNRMELQAAISACHVLTCRCQVSLYSDSQYVVNGINDWIKSWVRNNWYTSSGNPVVNVDLWQEVHRLKQMHKIKAYWVRGHNGNPGNELCDQVALTIQHIHGGYVRSGG